MRIIQMKNDNYHQYSSNHRQLSSNKSFPQQEMDKNSSIDGSKYEFGSGSLQNRSQAEDVYDLDSEVQILSDGDFAKSESVKQGAQSRSITVFFQQESNQQAVSVDKAEMYLKFAEAIKKNLPMYSISSILCGLQKELSMLIFTSNDQQKKQNQLQYNAFNQNGQRVRRDISSIHLSRASAKPQKVGRIRQRQLIQRQVAHAFITRGYGLMATRQCIKQQIDANKYNSVLTSIIRGTIRKLCDIMNRNLNQNIKEFDMEQEKILRSPLVNYKKWLTRSQQQTFFKIINIVYSMNQVPIYQDQVLTLYDRILRQLNKRNENARQRKIRKQQLIAGPHHPPNFNRFETVINPARLQNNNINPQLQVSRFSRQRRSAQGTANYTVSLGNNYINAPENVSPNHMVVYEKQIVELYVRFNNLDSIQAILSKKYRDHNWNREDIQKVIVKLLKIAIKKVLKYRREFLLQNLSVPSLNMNEALANLVITSPMASEARINLMKSLLDRNYTLTRTIQLVNLINHVGNLLNQQ